MKLYGLVGKIAGAGRLAVKFVDQMDIGSGSVGSDCMQPFGFSNRPTTEEPY